MKIKLILVTYETYKNSHSPDCHTAIYRSGALKYTTQSFEVPELYLMLLLNSEENTYSVEHLDGTPFHCIGDLLTTDANKHLQDN